MYFVGVEFDWLKVAKGCEKEKWFMVFSGVGGLERVMGGVCGLRIGKDGVVYEGWCGV